MKVLHLATSKVGGAGIAASRLNTALQRLNVDSTLVTKSEILEVDSNGLLLYVKKLINLKSKFLTFFQANMVQNSNELITSWSVSGVSKSKSIRKKMENADVIHIHATYNFISNKDLEHIAHLKKPVVVTMHDERFITGGCHYINECTQFESGCVDCPKVKALFQSSVSKDLTKKIEIIKQIENLTIITPSFWLAERIKNSKIKIARVHVIRNPIPDVYFENNIKNKKRDKIVFGFVAADLWNGYKGLNGILSAVKLLDFKARQKIKMIYVGKTSKPIRADVEYEILEAHNDLQMARIYRDLDFLLVPSTQDNFPSVIPEALASGVTIIGSPVGGIAEAMEEFDQINLLNQSPLELARILLKCVSDEQAKPAPNRNQVENAFSEINVARRMMGIYKQITD